MAVAVVEKTSGTASSGPGVTVTFADAVTGDLIIFAYGCHFKTFGNGDWIANAGWSQIPSSDDNGVTGYLGMCFHTVAPGETSWNPVNDAGNTVAGAWIAYRVQGHSAANPVANYFFTEPVHNGVLHPNTTPGANTVKGMMFTSAYLPGGAATTITGGVSGGTSWHVDTQVDTSAHMCAAYVAAIDNTTPATGSWDAGASCNSVQAWVIQAAPGAPSDSSSAFILKEEVVTARFSGATGNHISFNLSWTPTPGNLLLAVFLGSPVPFFPTANLTPTSHWTLLDNPVSGSIVTALRTVQGGDGTAYTVSTTGGGSLVTYYAYVFELTNATFASLGDALITSPNYTTPLVGGAGETLCFFAQTIYTGENDTWSQYAMLSSQFSDGCGADSINIGGNSNKFVSSVSHKLTTGGGQGSTGFTCTTDNGLGSTIVFDVVGVTCDLLADLNFRGNVSGLFYVKTDMGSETVPTLFVDSSVTIDNGTMSPTGQQIAQDGQWITWHPNSGPLSIPFPARTLWVVTTQAKASPPSIPVYATSVSYPMWKQTCTE